MANSTNWTASSINSTNYGPQSTINYDDSTVTYDTTSTGHAQDYYEGAVPLITPSTNWSPA